MLALLVVAACTTDPDNPDAPSTSTATVPPTVTALPPTASPEPTAPPTPEPTASATPKPTNTPTPVPTASLTATPEPPPIEITALELHDIDGATLGALSADEHPYFGGNTPVHGVIRIEGVGTLADVVLEVRENDVVIATAPLVEDARAALLGPLDAPGGRAIAESRLLFALPSTSFAAIDKISNGPLTLRVRAVSDDGREATSDYLPEGIWKLIFYRGQNRYLSGDMYPERGGNDWVQPAVNTIIASWEGVQIGDFSDLNGGPFPPHVSHQLGLDIDVWFPGYENHDAYAAEMLLTLIDSEPVLSHLDLIFVAYSQTDGDPFWEAIREVTLSDGRTAAQVIHPEPGHTGHFHVRFQQWDGP